VKAARAEEREVVRAAAARGVAEKEGVMAAAMAAAVTAAAERVRRR
jgi:hypothetical protein